MSGPSLPTLEQGLRRITLRRLELEARGHTSGLAKAAVARAWGQADFKTRHLSEGLRDAAFLETLEHELARAETWIHQELSQTA